MFRPGLNLSYLEHHLHYLTSNLLNYNPFYNAPKVTFSAFFPHFLFFVRK